MVRFILKSPKNSRISSVFCIIGRFKRKNLYFNILLIDNFCMSVYAKSSPNLTVGTACKKMKKLAF